jgi:hypothetical protein
MLPIPFVVDKDKVRMLVADVGYKLASQETGIRQGTLRQWARRFKWKSAHTHSQAVTTVTKPIAQAHADCLAALRTQSTFGLASYSARAATAAAKHPKPLEIARKVADLSTVHKTVFPEQQQQSSVLQIGVLIGEIQPQEVTEPLLIEAEHQSSQADAK